jgi:serine/threonine protein kinase
MKHPSRIGKYELEQFLGGGMSHVYRAKDTVLGRRVAVKILTESGAADAEAKARFLLEARMASNISHENIISVYDFGEEQGRPYIVMEFLEGESLRDAIRLGHVGDFASRMGVALQVARALHYIHSRKIIHRDIKPENVHISTAGKVKLMDFGIAKSEGVQLTRAGFTLGTPFYMAPEQVMGRPLTPQADIYAFGILLYELLAGVKPVAGETIEQIFQSILHEPLNLEPLKAVAVPPLVLELITACTAKNPAERPQDLRVVCELIEHVLDPAMPKPARLVIPPSEQPSLAAAQPTGQAGAARPAEAAAPAKPTAPVPARQAPLQQPPVRTQTPQASPTGQRSPANPDMPRFLASLPAPFRTEIGLMTLAAISVCALMMCFVGLAWLLRLI